MENEDDVIYISSSSSVTSTSSSSSSCDSPPPLIMEPRSPTPPLRSSLHSPQYIIPPSPQYIIPPSPQYIIPPSSEDNVRPRTEEERIEEAISQMNDPVRVRNLRDILRYTTQMARNNTSGPDRNEEALSFEEERRRYLADVLATMSINVQEEMNNSINILLDDLKCVVDHECAFDVLMEYIDSIDYANDFEKLGGFKVIVPFLKSEHKSLRTRACVLIATLVQHNPYCQEKFIERPEYARLLMRLVERDVDDEVRVKAMHAISCLIRHNIRVFWKFKGLGGINVIINSLKSSSDKMKVKAAFLINCTCQMSKDIAEMYVQNGVVENISSIIMTLETSMEIYHHEIFLATLGELLRVSPRAKELCSPNLPLRSALVSLEDSYPDDNTLQEEKETIVWLMQTLML